VTTFHASPALGRRRTSAPRISIVVPALNEALNLAAVLPQLPPVHEVILVDGGSVDGTVQAARRALPSIVTVLQGRRGKGNALAAGFARVTGDIVVMFDADGSADPAEISRFVEALTDGADVAKGSRYAAGGGSADITPVRSGGNRALNALFNLGFRTRHSDLCYGFNAFWADMLPALELPDHTTPPAESGRMVWGDGFEIETLISCRFAAAGARVTEVASVEKARLFGESNLHAVSDGLRVLRTLVTEWARARVQGGVERRERRRASRRPAVVSEPALDLDIDLDLDLALDFGRGLDLDLDLGLALDLDLAPTLVA
jgi:glycosyltransferase involved in cell wall biosynthesis